MLVTPNALGEKLYSGYAVRETYSPIVSLSFFNSSVRYCTPLRQEKQQWTWQSQKKSALPSSHVHSL